MRCALVVPAWNPSEIFSAKTAGSQINYWQPLGTLYIASSLIKAGHEIRFINGAFTPHEQIMQQIEEFSPDAVGIYSTTFGWSKASELASEVKKLNSNILIFCGGPFPVARGTFCLEDAPDMDIAVTGEGEHTSVEILARLQAAQREFKGIKGIVWRDGTRIVDNGPGELIDDLDSIPYPARELLGETIHGGANQYMPPPATYRRQPVAVVITSRGCNRRCIYCFQIDRHRTKGIRYRSVDNVLDEVELCLKQGYREIKFIDDTLAADYDRALELTRGIKERGLDFTWFASACVNQVDKPLLQAFRDAGCWAILFGAESGVQSNLNTIRKGIRLEDTVKAVRAAKAVGLKVLTPFLFGIPGQTYQDGLDTIEFACRLNPHIANFHALTPFPGTELYDNIEQYGSRVEDYSDYTYQGIAFVPHTMSRQEIAELRQLAFRRFYSRPSFLIQRFLAIRTANDIKVAYYGLRSLFWLYMKKGLFNRA